MGVPEKTTSSNSVPKSGKGTNAAPWYVFYIPYILLYLSLLILLYIDYKLIETDKMEFIIFTNGIAVFVAILSFTNMLSRDPAINNTEFRRALISTLIIVFFTVLAIEATKVDTGQSPADNKNGAGTGQNSKIYDNLVGILIGAVTTIVGVYTGARLTEEREEAHKEKKRGSKGEDTEAGGDEVEE